MSNQNDIMGIILYSYASRTFSKNVVTNKNYLLPLLIIMYSITGYCQTITPIGSGIREQVQDNIFFGMHIAKLNDEYFIGGKFDLADSVDVNNVTIWDGEKFEDAGTGISEPVIDIFTFENEVYVLESNLLKKWNGTTWDNMQIEGTINGKHIQGDTLYLYGHKLTINDINESSAIYFTNRTWYSVLINWDLSPKELEGFTIYNDTTFISTTRRTYKIDDSANLLLSLQNNGRLTHIHDKLFLTDHQGMMYEYRNSKWVGLLEVHSQRHEFFVMEGDLFYGELNEGTFRYVNNNFEQVIGRELQILDVELLDNNSYLIVGNLYSGSDLSGNIDLK